MDAEDITFSQRMGEEPLGEPLPLRTLSKNLRNDLWALVFERMRISTRAFNLSNNWEPILLDYHVHYLHREFDTFRFKEYIEAKVLKDMFFKGSYNEILDFLELALNHKTCPPQLENRIVFLFKKYKAAYDLKRIREKILFVVREPLRSKEDICAQSAKDIYEKCFDKAGKHFLEAMKCFRKGDFQGSILENILSLEEVMKFLVKDISMDLEWGIDECSKIWPIHDRIKKSLTGFYGYTREKNTIKHFMLEESGAFDEIDVLFFQNFCHCFISYLIRKSKKFLRNRV